jgi:hypothetical protein
VSFIPSRDGWTLKGKDTYKTSNHLAWAGAIPDERAEDGEAGTKHACSTLEVQVVWDEKNELLVGDDAGGVTS